MLPDQFRAALADLGFSQVGFARIALVDARTVRRWCDGTRAVPGPVVALLRMQMVTDECREIALERWNALLPEGKP
jgi:DNA-binding transcriptional regulator YiaG